MVALNTNLLTERLVHLSTIYYSIWDFNCFIIKESNTHPFMNFDLMTLAHSLLVHYGSVELRPPELKGCPHTKLASIKM